MVAVGVERLGVDAVGDAPEQAQARLPGLRQRRPSLGQLELARLGPCDRAKRRGRALAQTEARRRVGARRHLDALEPAGEVGADVQHVGRAFLEREQGVEARDAVGVGRRDVEAA